MSLTGKVAIITGASNGIGFATLKAFLAAGAKVLGVDIAPAPKLEPENPNFHFLQISTAAAGAPKAIVDAAIKSFGPRIDVLANVAGVVDPSSGVDAVTDEDWDRLIAVNLTAPMKLTRDVIQVMRQQKSGSIINVSSKAGSSGAVAGAAYTSSKHGLVGLTKNTAWIYKDEGIRCNAIAPGAVKTNIGKNIAWDLFAFSKTAPVHATHANIQTGEGAVEPDISAQLILFLASDASLGINGAIIPADNAWSVI